MTTQDASNVNLNSGACIGIAEFANPADQTKIIDRYSNPNPFANCDTALSTTIVNDYTALTSHYNDVKTKFTAMQNDNTNGFANLIALDNKLSAAIWKLTQPLQSLNSTVGGFLTLVGDPKQGLESNLNCSVIGVSARMVYDNMCVGLLWTLYQAAIILALASLFSFVGGFFLYRLAKRYTALKDAMDEEKEVKKFAPVKSKV